MAQEPDWPQFAVLPDVQSMATSMFDPYWGREFHVNKRFEILHIVDGQMNLDLGDRSFSGTAGDTLLIPKGTRHRDVFDTSAGLKIFNVSFFWEAEHAFNEHVNNTVLQGMPVHRKHEIARVLDRMRAGGRVAPVVDMLLASVQLHVVLILMLREAIFGHQREKATEGTRKRMRRRELMDAAKTYLHDHYSDNITLEQIANVLNVSPYYLSHVFSEESDFTLFHYLMTLRMQKALQLIQSGGDKISYVAAAVGYDNPNYFARVFRKYYGRSPSEARRSE